MYILLSFSFGQVNYKLLICYDIVLTSPLYEKEKRSPIRKENFHMACSQAWNQGMMDQFIYPKRPYPPNIILWFAWSNGPHAWVSNKVDISLLNLYVVAKILTNRLYDSKFKFEQQ